MDRLKALRRERRLSQQELAGRLSIAHSTVQRLETGKMKLTDVWTARFAAALGVAPAEIVVAEGGFARTEQVRRALELLRSMPAQAADAWLAIGSVVVELAEGRSQLRDF